MKKVSNEDISLCNMVSEDTQLKRLIQYYLSCNEEQRTALVEIVNLTTQIIKGEN